MHNMFGTFDTRKKGISFVEDWGVHLYAHNPPLREGPWWQLHDLATLDCCGCYF